MSYLLWLAVAIVVVAATWALMIVLARRLPSGAAKELVEFLPDCVTTVRRLRNDARVPRRAKLAVGFAGVWVLSPIDLIPEFLPVIGPLDDVVVVALAFRYAARQVPRTTLLEAWPGEPAIIERLLGPAVDAPTTGVVQAGPGVLAGGQPRSCRQASGGPGARGLNHGLRTRFRPGGPQPAGSSGRRR